MAITRSQDFIDRKDHEPSLRGRTTAVKLLTISYTNRNHHQHYLLCKQYNYNDNSDDNPNNVTNLILAIILIICMTIDNRMSNNADKTVHNTNDSGTVVLKMVLVLVPEMHAPKTELILTMPMLQTTQTTNKTKQLSQKLKHMRY